MSYDAMAYVFSKEDLVNACALTLKGTHPERDRAVCLLFLIYTPVVTFTCRMVWVLQTWVLQTWYNASLTLSCVRVDFLYTILFLFFGLLRTRAHTPKATPSVWYVDVYSMCVSLPTTSQTTYTHCPCKRSYTCTCSPLLKTHVASTVTFLY